MTSARILFGALVAAGGVVLLISLWLPWYRLGTGHFLVLFGNASILDPSSNTAWGVFEIIVWLLAAAGGYAVILGVRLAVRQWRRARRVVVLAAMPPVLSAVLIVLRIILPPRPPVTVRLLGLPALNLTADYGAYLGLLGALLAVAGLAASIALPRDG